MGLPFRSHFEAEVSLILAVVFIPCVLVSEVSVPNTVAAGNTFIQDLKMPGVTPTQHDEYLCTAKKLDPKESYIVQFEVHSENNKAHHILLFGCQDVQPRNLASGHWRCDDGNICDNMKIMFAWAKNAPPTTMPPDVGFRIGGKSGVNYLVLEIHYAHPLKENDTSGIFLHTTYEEQKYTAGIFLLLAQSSHIPPLLPKVHSDINCLFQSKTPIHPFAYRVHAHSLGVVITGYKYNTIQQKWTQLGKGNPQWPQAFYPMDKVYTVDSEDILAARCTYNATARNRWTYIGSTAADEMCNFYIMYYTDSQLGSPFGECIDMKYPELPKFLPSDSDVPLPRNPLLEEHASHGMHSSHTQVDKKGQGHHLHPSTFDYYGPDYSTEDATPHFGLHRGKEGELVQNNIAQTHDYTDGTPHRGTVHHSSSQADETGGNSANGEPQGKVLFDISPPKPLNNLYTEVADWPIPEKQLGQVTAVALDSHGNVVIFHRGKRIWDSSTFDVHNRFRQEAQGLIQENTILTFDQGMGNVIQEWGGNLFHMPHGLTMDYADNVWVTDVALHQVMKFPAGGANQPVLVLGTRLEPGTDDKHFCKPASVAVAKTGEFFVADGYCNSRILKYSPTGQLLLQWGKRTTAILGFKVGAPPPFALDVPHKLTLAEDKGLVCVADRENGRVQCFTMANGTFHCQIRQKEFGDRLFAVAYSPAQGGLLYAVNGASVYGSTSDVQGFVVNLTTSSVLGVIRPSNKQNLNMPHDLAVSLDGSTVYIAEIGPNKLWKFVSNHLAPKPATVHPSTTSPLSIQSPTSTGVPKPVVGPVQSLHVTEENKAVKEELLPPSSAAYNSSNLALSLIIIAVLAIPLLLLVLISAFFRLRKQGNCHSINLGHVKGWMSGYKQPNNDRFNLGNFLQPHKGFDPVNVEESDGELENSDSDVEEYSASAQKA